MIFNIPVGASKTVSVTLHGAPNEEISYSGKASGKTTLDAYGKKTIALKTGTYTFTGKTSGHKEVSTIKADATVNVHPAGAIFWYGNGDTSGDTLWSKFGTGFVADSGLRPSVGKIGKNANFTFTPKDNSYEIHYSWYGTGKGYVVCANAYLNKSLDTTGYSKIHVAGSMTGVGNWHSTDDLVYEFTPLDSVSGTPAELDAGSHLVFNQTGNVDPYGSMKNTITIDAIWLE
jgi:hypothetical protein